MNRTATPEDRTMDLHELHRNLKLDLHAAAAEGDQTECDMLHAEIDTVERAMDLLNTYASGQSAAERSNY